MPINNPIALPSGAIILWSGAISAIPSGYVLCDGNNSTPNLTDRFVIHADADAVGTNNVGDSGGVKEHTLTVNEMPSHTHDVVNVMTHDADPPCFEGANYCLNESTITSAATGGGAAHTNRDKYYALAYIMKT